MERVAVARDRRVGAFLLFERHELGQPVLRKNAFLEEGDVYLKIERRGSRIYGFTSKDGKHWAQLKPIDTVWPSQLKVGINAINSGNEPFQVRFEELTSKGKAPSGS
jgi:hypothetical protein